MASRNYGNAYNTEYNRDLLDELHANDMYRDTNGQPSYMEPQRLFRGARDYTDRFSRSVGGAMCGDIGRYGGNFVNDRGEVVREILNHPHIYRGAPDAGQPSRRPPGMISPHHKMAFQKVLPGTQAYLPQYNAEELYDVNQENYQVNVFDAIMDEDNGYNGSGYSGGNVGEIYRDEGGNFVAPTQAIMGAGKMSDYYNKARSSAKQFAESDLGQSVIPIAKMGAKSGLKKLASTFLQNPIYRSAANKMIDDSIGSGLMSNLGNLAKTVNDPKKLTAAIKSPKGQALMNIAKEIQTLRGGGSAGETLADELIDLLKPHINKLGTALSPEGKKIFNQAKKEINKLTGAGFNLGDINFKGLLNKGKTALENHNAKVAAMTPAERKKYREDARAFLKGGGTVSGPLGDALATTMFGLLSYGVPKGAQRKKYMKDALATVGVDYGKGWGAAEGYNPDNTKMTDEQKEAYFQKTGVDLKRPRGRPRLPDRILKQLQVPGASGGGLDLKPKKRGRPKKVPLPPSVQVVMDGEPSKTIPVVGGMFSGLRDRIMGSTSTDTGDMPYEDKASKTRRGVQDNSYDMDDFDVDLDDEAIYKELKIDTELNKRAILLKLKDLLKKGIGKIKGEKIEKRLRKAGKTMSLKDWFEAEIDKLDGSPSVMRPELSPEDRAAKYGHLFGNGKGKLPSAPKKRGRPKKGGNVETTIENIIQKVAPTNSTDKRKARAALIKKVMSEMKLKLGDASKYIKENNLI